MPTGLEALWFSLIGLLWAGYFLLEGFDFGVGMISPVVSRDGTDRRLCLTSIGPVWDGNEVWLIVAGGATFAAFPLWYARLFSGAYLALFVVLLALIVRNVSFEFRHRVDSVRWRHTWDTANAAGSLVAAPGRRVALTGPTGSGKSSVLHVLLHLLEISRGSATLGGVEVREMTHAGLARHAAWLADDTHVFAASLSDNLRLARPDAGDAECAEALERVGLGPWCRSLPGGLRTLLGAGGRALSAGERQRLGMARALLSGAGLLLLDEPTAHIDPAAAPRLLSELLGVAGARAVLVVDHGPWPAGEVDAVVMLDGGRVISTAPRARPPGGRGPEHEGTNDARQPGPWPLLAGTGGHPD